MLRHLSLVLAGFSQSKVLPFALRTSSTQFLHTSFVGALCSAKNDIPPPNLPVPAEKLRMPDTDILLEQIRKARTPEKLLQLVSMHLDVMNCKHIVSSFDTIFTYVMEKRNELIKYDYPFDLANDATFQALCNHTLNRARYFEPSEVINIFKTLSILGIKNNTYIMQAILKMICSQVNELSLSELSFLNFLLFKQKSNDVIVGLRMALPLVLQVQIEQQMDSNNINEVLSCLKMSCKSKLKASTIEKIIGALINRSMVLSPEQAIIVIISLLQLEVPVNGYLELINKAFLVALRDFSHLKNEKILHVLRLCNKSNFFHKGFFIKSAEKAISDSWSLSEVCELQRNLHQLGFYSEDLLNYLCKEVLNNSGLGKEAKLLTPLILAGHYACTDCKPPNIELVLEMLCNSDDQLSFMYESRPGSYVEFVSYLSILGYFHPKVFDMGLNESFLSRAWSACRKFGRSLQFERSICSLQWFLDITKVPHIKVPTSVFEQVFRSMRSRIANLHEYPLTKFIENGLGGNQFFCTGILTRNGHIIDHVLAMRNGNFPVCLSSSNSGSVEDGMLPTMNYIEDIPVPHDAKIVAIVVAKEEHYWKDPVVLHGWMKLKIRNLSHMGFFPVVINFTNWQALPDREKIPYLMSEIKRAIEFEDLSKINI